MDEHGKWRNEVKVGVDLGTSKLAVSFTFPGSPKVQLLKFSSSFYAQKKVEELDAVLGYAPSGWHYGPDVKVLDDAIAFSNIKLGIIGHEPYLSLLKGSFRAAAKKYGVKETPVTLFQKLFSHILATLKRLFDQPENQHYYAGRTFRDLEKSCSVTYPVQQNGSLKIVLVEAALAAGFHRVNGVSEPLAAAHYIVLQPQPIISCNETFLIIDCGGGTFDLATVERRTDGGIRQVCPTDGFPSGGESVNDAARAYLLGLFGDEQNLKDDHKWSTKISPRFDRCKGAFGKGVSLRLEISDNRTTTLEPAVMESFFEPLVSKIEELCKAQYQSAAVAGRPPDHVVLCGGPMQNRWFSKTVIDRIQTTHSVNCISIEEVGVVAMGALIYAQNPLTEVSVASNDIGFTYWDDRLPSGEVLGGDEVKRGIAWVIVQGQPAGRFGHGAMGANSNKESESYIELVKTVFRVGNDRPNLIISTDVYTTEDGFPRSKIRKNDDEIDWKWDITYPFQPVGSKVQFLGRIEAPIPHEQLFPGDTDHDKVEAHFIFSIRPEGQLLKVDAFLKLDDDERLMLQKSYVPAASWTLPSERNFEEGRYGDGKNSLLVDRKPRRPRRGKQISQPTIVSEQLVAAGSLPGSTPDSHSQTEADVLSPFVSPRRSVGTSVSSATRQTKKRRLDTFTFPPTDELPGPRRVIRRRISPTSILQTSLTDE